MTAGESVPLSNISANRIGNGTTEVTYSLGSGILLNGASKSKRNGDHYEQPQPVYGPTVEDGEPLCSSTYISQPENTQVVGEVSPWKGLKHFYRTGGLRNPKGMSVLVTALFIVGETAGGGLVAMAHAVAFAGLKFGVAILLMGAAMCEMTGQQLGECWSIVQLRYPKYRSHCRKPYPTIARCAIGRKTAHLVSVTLDMTMFGTAAVFLLLAARNLENMLMTLFQIQLSYCVIVCFTAIVIFPLTLLKSPKDFSWAIVAAMITTFCAVCLMIWGIAMDSEICTQHSVLPVATFQSVFMAFGTVMFAYGGHGAFPTIHHDMHEPTKFRYSVIAAFIMICMFYLPVSIMGAIVYGDSTQSSIILSVQDHTIQQTINILITLHVLLALTIVFNPLNQEVEAMLNLPNRFSWRHVLARGGVMLSVLAVAVSFPTFGPLLDLVGGSTITMMTLIFPATFNLYLNAKLAKYGPRPLSQFEPVTIEDMFKHNTRANLMFNIAAIMIGIIGGCASSYSAITALFTTEFSLPCYDAYIPPSMKFWSSADGSAADVVEETFGKFFCCGTDRNISAYGPSVCIPKGVTVSGGHGR